MKNPYEKFQDFKNSQKAELGNLKKKKQNCVLKSWADECFEI